VARFVDGVELETARAETASGAVIVGKTILAQIAILAGTAKDFLSGSAIRRRLTSGHMRLVKTARLKSAFVARSA
jgi:hypothetical protein